MRMVIYEFKRAYSIKLQRYFYRVPAEFHNIEPTVKLKLLSRTLLMDYLPNSRLSWNVTFSMGTILS
ncbi:unnamed protein product [Schistosoma bovis]|nr:unnamed protein product [Schistosoma bovis]